MSYAGLYSIRIDTWKYEDHILVGFSKRGPPRPCRRPESRVVSLAGHRAARRVLFVFLLTIPSCLVISYPNTSL